MKKRFCVGTFLVLSAVLCFQVGTLALEPGYVSISTTAEEDYAPNVAQITFSVETTDKDSRIASEKNKQLTTKIIEAVKKNVDTTKGETVKTKGFSVSPQYSYKNNKQIFEHYKVSNSFEVKIKDVNKVGKIINTGVQTGATRVNGLNFSLDLDDSLCNQLISKATKNAQERASFVAKSLNKKITGVKQISANCSNQQAYPTYRMMKSYTTNSLNSAESADVPTEAGTIKLMAIIDGQFYIGQ